MKKIILTLPFLLLSTFIFSQNDSLLKKFKFRIDKYRAINFNIAGAGYYNDVETPGNTTKSHSFSTSFAANYFTIKSTDRILLTSSAGLSSGLNSGKNESLNSDYKNKSFSVYPEINVLNKWYNKKMFTELGADVSALLNSAKTTQKNIPYTATFDQNAYSIAINTGIGKGRLENVTDMQNALWLYKTFLDENKLSRSLTPEELDELGRTITLANNTRVLDFRRRTRFILETVDNFFKSKNLIASNDIAYFSGLNDILFFAYNLPRLSGTELFIRVTPALNKENRDDRYDSPNSEFERKNTIKSIRASTGIRRYIPANLTHQNNYGISAGFNYISGEMSEKQFTNGTPVFSQEMNATLKQAFLNLFFEHAIYPNTRTVVSFNLRSETGYQDFEQDSGFFGLINISGNLNYFISYKTRLVATAGIDYKNNVYSYYHYFVFLPESIQLNANVGLQVSL